MSVNVPDGYPDVLVFSGGVSDEINGQESMAISPLMNDTSPSGVAHDLDRAVKS